MHDDGLTPGKVKRTPRKAPRKAQEGPRLFDPPQVATPAPAQPVAAPVRVLAPVRMADVAPRETIACDDDCDDYYRPGGCPTCAPVSSVACAPDDAGFCWAHGVEHVQTLDLMDEMLGVSCEPQG